MGPKKNATPKGKVKGDDSDDDTVKDARTMAMIQAVTDQMKMQYQEEMRLQRDQLRMEHQDQMRLQQDQMRMQHQEQMKLQQDHMAIQADSLIKALADLKTATGTPAGGGAPQASSKARRIEQPRLKGPSEVTLADFRDFKQRFKDFLAVTALDVEADAKNRIAYLRSSIDEAWSKLWQGGAFAIPDKDDYDKCLDEMYNYLRKHRSPLLDRREFYSRSRSGLRCFLR